MYVTCSLLSMDAFLAFHALTFKNVWKESLPTCTSRLNRKIEPRIEWLLHIWHKCWVFVMYGNTVCNTVSLTICISEETFKIDCIIRLFIFMRWWQSSISFGERESIFSQWERHKYWNCTNSLGFPVKTVWNLNEVLMLIHCVNIHLMLSVIYVCTCNKISWCSLWKTFCAEQGNSVMYICTVVFHYNYMYAISLNAWNICQILNFYVVASLYFTCSDAQTFL